MRPIRHPLRLFRWTLPLIAIILLVACGTPGSTATPAQAAATSQPTIAPTPPAPTATMTPLPTATTIPAATPTRAAAGTPRATPASLPPGAVALDLPLGDAYLSPDGARIAWTNEDDLCVYTTAGHREHCATPPMGVDSSSLQWSPDSRRLVFTENFFMFFNEPDLWVLDATTGALTNLTDDGFQDSDGLEAADRGALVDTSPRWTADSQGLIFIRQIRETSAIRASIWTIGLDGKPPVRRAVLNSIGLTTTQLALSPDGQTIAFDRGLNRTDDDRGVWVANLDGSNARHLIKFTNGRAAGHLDFSPDGRFLLASAGAYYGIKPEQTDQVQIVAVDGSGPLDVPAGARWATWAPTGTAIAYITQSTNARPVPDGLYSAPSPGQPARPIQAGAFQCASPLFPDRLPTWSSASTILLSLPDGRHALLRLS